MSRSRQGLPSTKINTANASTRNNIKTRITRQNDLLLLIEKEQLVNWILYIERCNFSTFIIDVKRLISRRGSRSTPPPIGYYWVYRIITRHPAIKQRLTRRRASREHRKREKAWRALVSPYQGYSWAIWRVDRDSYNFDEPSFAISVITESRAGKTVW